MDLVPPIPTDNLYKFIAISGLVIIGLTTFYPLKMVNESTLKTVQYATDMHKYSIERGRIATEYKKLANISEQLNKKAETHLAELKREYKKKMAGLPYTIPPAEKLELDDEYKENEKMLKQTSFELDLKNADLEGKKSELDIIKSNLFFLRVLMYVGFAIGALLTMYGFTLWYLKVQQPLDLILLGQSQRPINEPKETATSQAPEGGA